MLIFNEYSHPTIIDNIHGPTVSEYAWVLDLVQLDFMLTPIVMLEEVICPSVQLLVNGFEFLLPANWNILVYDRETVQLDVIELSETAGRQFTAFTYGPTKSHPQPMLVTITDYKIEHKNVSPSLNKHQLLCHPVGPEEWVCVGPSDVYNKYLKDITIGDLLSF